MIQILRSPFPLIVGLLTLLLEATAGVPAEGAPSPVGAALPSAPQAEHVILFVLEGLDQESLKGGAMPTLSKLVKGGAVTWSASGVNPALRLPTMASVVTGMPVEKHGIT